MHTSTCQTHRIFYWIETEHEQEVNLQIDKKTEMGMEWPNQMDTQRLIEMLARIYLGIPNDEEIRRLEFHFKHSNYNMRYM